MKINEDLIIVGIGSSAGGLEPLKTIVSNLSETSNLCFVLTSHLDPNQGSKLVEILSPLSPLCVKSVENKEIPKINTIYVCPPKYNLIFKDGMFHLVLPNEKQFSKPSINEFFESLAKRKRIDVLV